MNTLDNPTATMSPVKPKPKRKLDNVLWVILAVFTLYYSDFVTVLLYYPDIRGVFFNLASILGSTALLICAHCVLWSGYFKGVALDTWEKLYPLGVPIATATTLASGICWNFSLWPVYGIKTPFLTLILTMGFFMFVSILPSGKTEDPQFYTKVETKND